jgi:hypothetical protein
MEKIFKQKNVNNFVWAQAQAELVAKFYTGVVDTGGAP